DLLDSTIVLITGDHGEELWEHGGFGHGHSLYNELLAVPLLIRVPGRTGRLVEAEPDQIDIAPLILSLAGIENAGMEGTGLDPMSADNRTRRHFACATSYGDEKYSLAADGFKLIDNTGRRGGKTAPLLPVREAGFELFDLTRDAGERENLADAETGVMTGLAGELRRREGARPVAGRQTASPDRETVDKLKALGYLQ
ncbi:MAG TPA: sulfatase-like hydrolase/transferase, partial [bacterium]|nr:sulfatase-like hydrolase/transferase [bacterium]